ncbi:uncharacterized protein LOC112904024 isoform X2 [Agrilus planipennis]|uniref:Uncharacterized protein LOC112904024 isoform X2 n=2 Tax=Agrilus planipennis TaxID=224129 RepID=A0A7F5R1E6_AGRPL|nr:uncharacterized protein LOC112904024 isoform X2 [Agrilus planipennis]
MAVRILLEGSLRTTAAAIGLAALVAASLLLPVARCAPAPVYENEEKPWWHNPCSYNPNRIRHSRGIPPAVKTQLKTIVNMFNSRVSQHVQRYCSKFESTVHSKQIKKPDWLPTKKFFQSLDDNVSALPEFHYQIQIHAATLHKLWNMHIESAVSSFDGIERSNLMNDTAQHMKSLLCEVETAMNSSKLHRKKLVPINYVSDVQIPSKTNFTTGIVTDCTLLREYGNFLRKSNKKLSGKNRRRKAGKTKKAGKAGKSGKPNKNRKRTFRRRS